MTRDRIPQFTAIETSRLRIRPFRDDDAVAFATYRGNPAVALYQSWESYSEKEARLLISDMQRLSPGMPGQWYQFALELKTDAALIGDCGLYTDEVEPQGKVGYSLAPDYQGKGYAHEAVSAVFDYAFHRLGFHRVVAQALCENDRSIALMERLGMRREGHFIQSTWFQGRWADEYLYAILRDEWTDRADGLRPPHSQGPSYP